MMGITNVYLKDWHRRFAGQRFGFFEQFCLENGTTSFEALVTAAELRPHQTVLDLGCGEGPLLRYVLRRDVRYIGLDFSAASLAAARQQFGATAAEFVEADAGHMPLPDASCDVVLSHMALHIMQPVEPALVEVSRVLKPNGKLHVFLPASWRMHSSAEASRFQDVMTLFQQFKDVSTPTRVGTGKFATEQSISDTITSGFAGKATVSFRCADLMIHRPPTEALTLFTCWAYSFDLIHDEYKPEAAKTFLTKLIALKDGDGIVRLRRPMTIVSVSKA
jgi:ubiquinone/menaquinone biosynthesis C-methylase UbiE